MANYETAMTLRSQFTAYTEMVDELRKQWKHLDERNMKIKERFSQYKLLEKLEEFQETEKYDNLPRAKQMKICRRIDNLTERIDERFEKEYPELFIEYYKAYARFLEGKLHLNSLEVAEKAYYLGVVNR